jgi:hypothetical protein
MLTSFVSRSACPCCNKTYTDKSNIIKGRLDKYTEGNALREGWVGLHRNSFFSYTQCSDCLTLGTTEYPADNILSSLYSSMPPNMEEAVSEENQRKNQNQYAQIIASFLNRAEIGSAGLSVLELGSDCGLLADSISMVNETYDWNYTAIEPNILVREGLKATLSKKYGSHEIYSDVEQLISKEPTGSFDIIAAIHVFDHIFNIKELLTTLRDMLTENGFIFFVVHNPESLLAKALGTRWPAYCAQHPQLYTVKGIQRLANDIELRVATSGRTSNHFTLRMVGDYLGLSAPFLEKIPVRALLGNRYYILSKETIV